MRGTAPSMGDIVSILSGPDAGQWFQIAQVIQSPTSLSDPSYTLLMDSPLPLPERSQLRDLDRRGICQRDPGQHDPGPGKHHRHRGKQFQPVQPGRVRVRHSRAQQHFTGNSFYAQSGAQGNLAGPYSPFINPNNPGETNLPWGWTHTPNSACRSTATRLWASPRLRPRSRQSVWIILEHPFERQSALRYRPARKQHIRRLESTDRFRLDGAPDRDGRGQQSGCE